MSEVKPVEEKRRRGRPKQQKTEESKKEGQVTPLVAGEVTGQVTGEVTGEVAKAGYSPPPSDVDKVLYALPSVDKTLPKKSNSLASLNKVSA